jgi:hypothetical protein
MKVNRAVSVAALLPALAGVALLAGPAQAGDTGRVNGCAAHWRHTATWNECKNVPELKVNLNSDCDWEFDYTGEFKKVKGTVDPVDRFECRQKAISAWVGF